MVVVEVVSACSDRRGNSSLAFGETHGAAAALGTNPRRVVLLHSWLAARG